MIIIIHLNYNYHLSNINYPVDNNYYSSDIIIIHLKNLIYLNNYYSSDNNYYSS